LPACLVLGVFEFPPLLSKPNSVFKKSQQTMNRVVLIEAISVVIFGLASMAEGLRLATFKDPYILYDPLGPGLYILALSIGMVTVGVVHFLGNYRRTSEVKYLKGNKKKRIQVLSAVTVLVIYNFLIIFVGYLTATVTFYFLGLRVAGVKSWRVSLILAAAFTTFHYIMFVRFAKIVFPRGIFY
jgi:hypothetical protein